MNKPPCPDFAPLLSRFADGEASGEEISTVRNHLDACPPCRKALRALAELNRRIAESPGPPIPAGLEARIRAAIDRAQPGPARLLIRRWIPPAAAAAGLLVALGMLLRPPRAVAEIPPMIAASAGVHDRFLAGSAQLEARDTPEALHAYFQRILKADVEPPRLGGETRVVGGCCCDVGQEQVPWILYRRGATAISLILVEDGRTNLPDAARRVRDGRPYHIFKVGTNTVLVCRSGKVCHLWIARLAEGDLIDLVMETREGRQAFSGERLTIRGIT
jgi:anti-sigma factor RsiW